jgi:XTP/dITP diphosphohydrolase
MEIVLATKNEHKKKEIINIFKGMNLSFVTLKEYPDLPEVNEDGKTFEENAVKKAKEISLYTGKIAIADDSGLEVDVLNREPGIYSARFAGEHSNDSLNNQKLLSLLEKYPDKKDRKARFVCVMAIVDKDKIIGTAKGICEGYIAKELKGNNGFGYDPLFVIPEYNKTFAELGKEIKDKISHRAKALMLIKKLL